MDPDGGFWVADTASEFPLRLYDQDGTEAAAISTEILPSALGVAMDESGKLWVSGNEGYIYGIQINL